MASHASTATKLAARLASGEATEKDRAEAAKLAGRYSKQLARVFRERELAARPDLRALPAPSCDPATPAAQASVLTRPAAVTLPIVLADVSAT